MGLMDAGRMLRTAKMQTTPGDDGRGGADAGRQRDGLDPGRASRVPAHVGIIMDGNGRWAAARGLPRAAGHREGVEALKRTIRAAPDLGIRCLTVFGFSTENWSRPADEVSDLMGLVRAYVAADLRKLDRNGVRVRILGRREGLPADIAEIVARTEATTAGNEKFLLQVAFRGSAAYHVDKHPSKEEIQFSTDNNKGKSRSDNRPSAAC